MHADESMTNLSLNADDKDAVDALIDARMNVESIQGPHAARCRHVHALFAALDTPTGKAHDSLVDVTLARIMQADRLRAADMESVLVDEDQDALDALIDAGFRLDRVPSSLRARAETADRLARLVAQTPIPATPHILGGSVPQVQAPHRTDLIERTLARVDRAPRLVFADAPAPRSGWFRLSDLVSIAAVLVIGVAIMWPLLTAMRGNAERADCQANFGAIASALGLYSNDYKGQMPVATAGFGGFNGLPSRAVNSGGAQGGGTWWNVGTPSESNSANLFLLPKLRYASLPQFACPGNPQATHEAPSDAQDWPSLDRVSYSYYVMAGPSRPTWENGPVAVLADRSPVILRAVRREQINELENSPNHGGRGQQILRADGSAMWACNPVVSGDNIWLPRPMEVGLAEARRLYAAGARNFTIILWGNEAPGSPTDTFLGP